MKFGKHLDAILQRLCKVVGADFASVDFKQPTWFRAHSWSTATEEQFTRWLADYLYNNKDAQRELYVRSYMRKRDCQNAAKWFVFNYGWMNAKK